MIELLQRLIAMPSFSGDEEGTASILERFLRERGVAVNVLHNNVWAVNESFDPAKPTVLLNSHHDTVKPNGGYTRDPFAPDIVGEQLYGLGSNDAGGSVVALVDTFLHFHKAQGLKYNLCLALTAEEEFSGHRGMEALLPALPPIDFAIVGEPTQMQMAIAERGLMVLDCTAHGRAGHAAREEGDNAIHKAVQDITWFRDYRFEKISPLFGAVKMSVTMVNSGSQHNVVPAECRFVVDVRVTECYTHAQVLDTVRHSVGCDVVPRSMRLCPSKIDPEHTIVKAGLAMGLTTFGSPTTSDAALLGGIPALKIGVGDSARSHSADEYVYVWEVEHGAQIYRKLLTAVIV